MDPSDHIGEVLRRSREGAGLSIRDASSLLGVTPQTVFNWEHRLSRPYRRHERRIAEVVALLEETESQGDRQ